MGTGTEAGKTSNEERGGKGRAKGTDSIAVPEKSNNKTKEKKNQIKNAYKVH